MVKSPEAAIAFAEANGQGVLNTLSDGSITNQYGETMVLDSSGNLAPAPRDIPVGMVKSPDGGFIAAPALGPEASEAAIAFAEANGQGALNTSSDGSITNQYGETMVLDSSGNLAPAPRDIPVGMVKSVDGNFVSDPSWTPPPPPPPPIAPDPAAFDLDNAAAVHAAAAAAAAAASDNDLSLVDVIGVREFYWV